MAFVDHENLLRLNGISHELIKALYAVREDFWKWRSIAVLLCETMCFPMPTLWSLSRSKFLPSRQRARLIPFAVTEPCRDSVDPPAIETV